MPVSPPSNKQHIVIIGAGLAGMGCALILAKHNYRVTLVEREPHLGPVVRGFYRQGVYFDTGLHYMGELDEAGVVRRYLRYLGLEDLGLTPYNPDCFDEIRFPASSFAVRLPIGYEAMLAALGAAFPAESEAVRAYMQTMRGLYAASTFLELKPPQPQTLSGHAMTESLAAFLDRHTTDPRLRSVLSIHTMLHGVAPTDVSLIQHAYVIGAYLRSVHAVTGGGLTLVKAMETQLNHLGVTSRCGLPVRKLLFDDARALHGVELANGARIAADGVIYTAHPGLLPDMVPPGVFKPAFTGRLRELRDTMSAFMLFGVASEKPACLDGNNLFICLEDDITAAFTANTRPEDGPFYVTACSVPALKEGNSSGCGVIVMTPGSLKDVQKWENSTRDKRPPDYLLFKRKVMERMQSSLFRHCPELRSVRFIDCATPLTMRDYLGSVHGGLYGSGHALSQFNPLPVTRTPNLWLAGQSVTAPGLTGAMLSAFLACGFLIGHETLRKEVEQCNEDAL